MKTCSKCKQTKPLSEFYKNRRGICKSCRKAYQLQYRQTPGGKAVNRKANAKYRAHNPHYHKANNAVNNAIRDGKLPRPDTLLCHYCPKPAKQYHHWHGYEPECWLDVVPVCVQCHIKVRKKIA